MCHDSAGGRQSAALFRCPNSHRQALHYPAGVYSPLVAGLLLLRSTPRALMNPVVSALVHPRVQSEIRATLLSLLSFAGRLCFGGVLLATSLYFGDEASLKYAQLSPLLLTFALAALLTLICMSIAGAAIQNFLVLRRTTHVKT